MTTTRTYVVLYRVERTARTSDDVYTALVHGVSIDDALAEFVKREGALRAGTIPLGIGLLGDNMAQGGQVFNTIDEKPAQPRFEVNGRWR